MKARLKRDLSQSEFDYLPRDLAKGEVLFYYGGATYGCISRDGRRSLKCPRAH